MEFRKAVPADLKQIMEIIKDAQGYLKELGIDQWQNQYPSEETILTDMHNGHGYVLLDEGNIIATVAISFDGEPTYEPIYDGAWLSNEDYAVIHRLAVGKDNKGKARHAAHSQKKRVYLLRCDLCGGWDKAARL